MVGADWTPLDDFAENFEDDFVENFEDNPFHAVDDALPTEKRLAKVDQIGKDLAAEAEAKAKKRAQKNAERAENIRKDLEIRKKERIEEILNREPHPGEALHAKIKSGEIKLSGVEESLLLLLLSPVPKKESPSSILFIYSTKNLCRFGNRYWNPIVFNSSRGSPSSSFREYTYSPSFIKSRKYNEMLSSKSSLGRVPPYFVTEFEDST